MSRDDYIGVELLLADMSMRQFLWSQYLHAARLGYPRLASFAVDIAHGTVSLPPRTEDDPINESVGNFYRTLTETERLVLSDHYLPRSGTMKERAMRAGQTVGQLRRTIKRLLTACLRWLRSIEPNDDTGLSGVPSRHGEDNRVVCLHASVPR